MAADAKAVAGGPATAAVGWVDDLLAHAAKADVPLDFISTHTYGLPPLDLRAITARFGRPNLPLWWTEWGVSPVHGAPINDSVWAAPLVCRGMRSAAGRLESLAYWVASDHFVELGEPERLFHGGFGLLTIGNLRKPRFWALRILELLGELELAITIAGDGAGGLVRGVGDAGPGWPRRGRALERDDRSDEGRRRRAPGSPHRAPDRRPPSRPVPGSPSPGRRESLEHCCPLGWRRLAG